MIGESQTFPFNSIVNFSQHGPQTKELPAHSPGKSHRSINAGLPLRHLTTKPRDMASIRPGTGWKAQPFEPREK
jgi:hypothetical protein